MIWQTGLVTALLATGVHAGIGDLVFEGMSRNSPSYERRMQEIAKRTLLARGIIETRQLQGNNIFNTDGRINVTAWDEIANSACITALSTLPKASNPSGTCICYNLPALDRNSGRFEADLRLYSLGVPTGDFAGIPPQNVDVSLGYKSASVSAVTLDTASQKVISPGLVTRQAASASQPGDLQLLQTYHFLGQINQDQMAPDMPMQVPPNATCKEACSLTPSTGPNYKH